LPAVAYHGDFFPKNVTLQQALHEQGGIPPTHMSFYFMDQQLNPSKPLHAPQQQDQYLQFLVQDNEED
jgi:hypothetical protein